MTDEDDETVDRMGCLLDDLWRDFTPDQVEAVERMTLSAFGNRFDP